jgi:hypothetical protein
MTDSYIAYGGAKPIDACFATVHGVDEDIFKILKRRQERKRRREERPMTHIGGIYARKTRQSAGLHELEKQIEDLLTQRRIVANRRDPDLGTWPLSTTA